MKKIIKKLLAYLLIFSIGFAEPVSVFASDGNLEIQEEQTKAAKEITDQDLSLELDDSLDESDVTYEVVELGDTLDTLKNLDINTVTSEELNNILNTSPIEVIGEWFTGLGEEEQKSVLGLQTILIEPVYEISSEGSINNESSMRYYELASMYYMRSMISPLGWNDEFIGGDTGRARYFLNFYCDNELVGHYTIDIPSVVHPNDLTTVDLSLSYISGSLKQCSKGHDLNVKLNKIEAFTDSVLFWSGIRIYGSYVRPGGYITTDYATNSKGGNSAGFDDYFYTSFGTDAHVELSYDNDQLLDARYHQEAVTDNFVFNANMYNIGLYDEGIDNFGLSTYHINVMPSGRTYYINPNGGIYNGSTGITTYESYNAKSETEIITVPIWKNELTGKKFIGWSLDSSVLLKKNGTKVEVEGKIDTEDEVELYYVKEQDGKYVNKVKTDTYYGSYIEWPNTKDTTLTALWQTEWIKVKFDTNEPADTSETATGMDYTEKTVYYNDKYGELPAPELDGYYFLGWYTDPEGGELVTEDTICKATESHTLYAHWQKALFHVDFDLNIPKDFSGATVSGMTGYENGKEVWYKQPYGYLPDNGNNNWPSPKLQQGNANIQFLGWYTSPSGGTEITASTIYNALENSTVYAHWNETLYLDTKVNLGYNSYTINGITFNKGGVDLDWSDYVTTTGYFNSYMRKSGTTTWTRTLRKTKNKTYADTTATDNASPNAIDETSIEKSQNGNNTSVNFKAPEDNGTSYDFYISERTYQTTSLPSTTKSYQRGTQSYSAPMEGIYQITLRGGGSASGQKGAVVTGRIELSAGQTLYLVTGGAGSGSTGGYNGGGNGAYGGGGATQVTTTNRGLLTAYNNYRNEVLAVAAGAGGNGGNGTAFVYWADMYGNQTSTGGTGGNSGSNGGNSMSTPSNNGGKISGGFGGTISNGGTNTTYNPNGDIFWGTGQIMSGNGSSVTTGTGGGGGAGWSSGGGGSAGWAFGTGSWSSGKNGYVHKRPNAGGNGTFGQGGSGGAGAYYAADGSNSDRTKRSPFSSSGGGGGAGGQSYYGGLSSVSLSNGSNSGNGSVVFALVEDLNGDSYKESNVQTEVVTTGIKGYRYVIDRAASTTLTASSGTFTQSTTVKVANQNYEQWLHIAAQDGAGNISTTVHIKIEPTYNISYNLNGGLLPEGQENPTSYTQTTEDFTLINPEKEGYEFIGWTGSNGTTPELEVTIKKGTTGNLSFTANYMSLAVNVTEVKIDGTNIYNPSSQKWFVKAGTNFSAEFESSTLDHLSYFAPNRNEFLIKNSANQHIQTIQTNLDMEVYSGNSGRYIKNDLQLFEYISANLERNTSTQNLISKVTAKIEEDGTQIDIYPRGYVIVNTDNRLPAAVYKSTFPSEEWDVSKKATVIADGISPVVDETVSEKFITEDDWRFVISDGSGSGVNKDKTRVYLTNTSVDPGTRFDITSMFTDADSSDNSSDLSAHIELTDSNRDMFCGYLKIEIVTEDKVGNTSVNTYYTSGGLSVEAVIVTTLPEHNNIFKAGERGYIDIELTGYIKTLEITFPESIEDVRTDEETQLSTIIELEPNPTATYRYYFDVPAYAEEGTYTVNVKGTDESGRSAEANPTFIVEGNILNDFRTTIRNNE